MFYRNIEAPETPSTPTASSPAEAMAKFGQKVNDTTAELPVVQIKQENQEPAPPTPEPSPVETTNETQSAEGGAQVQDTPAPQAEQLQEEPQTPVEQEPSQPTLTWQEVLKQQQPDTILKELGIEADAVKLSKELTPEMKAFFKYWKENGDVTPYLEAVKTDYSKMPAEEVMRHQLRKDYPKATERQLDALYKAEVIERFKIDPNVYTEEEVEEGKLLLEAKADKFREELIAKQKDFLLPPPPEAAEDEPDDDAAEQEAIKAYRTQIEDSSLVREIKQTGKLTIGAGDDKFILPVKGDELVELLTDNEKWASAMIKVEQDAAGNRKIIPDVQKQLLVAAFAKDPEGFLKEYAKHFKALGGKLALDPIENAKPPENTTPAPSEPMPKSPAEAMAKFGKIV